MGREVCRTVLHRPGLELAVAIDPGYAGTTVAELIGVSGPSSEAVVVEEDLSSLAGSGVEVVVDFTHLETSRAVLATCAAKGIHAVVGTTGFTEADLDELAELFAPGPDGSDGSGGGANCIVAKRDAPSGTSLRTAEGMAAARSAAGRDGFLPDATSTVVVEGARGGAGPGGIRMHSVRLPGLVAHQEVLFGSAGQGLTIRHDSYDRASFMDGVVLAVESVASLPGLTLGIEPLLGI
jgi:4-hydroxy-tetrahydrodipicolinate reductase